MPKYSQKLLVSYLLNSNFQTIFLKQMLLILRSVEVKNSYANTFLQKCYKPLMFTRQLPFEIITASDLGSIELECLFQHDYKSSLYSFLYLIQTKP